MRVFFTLTRRFLLVFPFVITWFSPAYAAPVVRHVCKRTPEAEAKNLKEWAYTKNARGSQVISPDQFNKLLATADVHYIFDPKAPADSVRHLPPPYNRTLACPGQKPLGDAANGAGDASGQTSGRASSAGSSGTGQGVKVTTWEELIRQISITAALVNGDVSGRLDHPEGSTSGIPSGKNVGGFSFPPLQLGVSILQILSSAGMSPKSFTDDVMKYAQKGQRVILTEVNETTLKMADDLVAQYGATMAPAFAEMQTILPFKIAQKFTRGLESRFQAHHILERRGFKDFGVEGVENAPAIILTREEHQQVTNKLNQLWSAKPPDSLTELHNLYKKAYVDHPHWLQAIESYFR